MGNFSLQPSAFSLEAAPPVTCLCPTYGRFARLRDAVACFILQDYPGKRNLVILNDAPEPVLVSNRPPRLYLDSEVWHIEVRNHPARLPTLGHKRQVLLESAAPLGDLVAHWDDDDLYLPWHLTQCVEALRSHHRACPESRRTADRGASCVKPGAAWWALGSPESFTVKGPCHNVFEGQMVFDRQRALDLGGYPPEVSGQAKALLEKFRKAGELYTWNPADCDISYVYRWDDGVHHISGSGNNQASHDAFAERNTDFGDGEPLIPVEAIDAPCPELAQEWARRRLAAQFRRFLTARLSCSESPRHPGFKV